MLKLTICVVLAFNNERYMKYLESLSQYYDQVLLITNKGNDMTNMYSGLVNVSSQYYDNLSAYEINDALSKATGDWILWLHEDEYIDEHDVMRLRDWMYCNTSEIGYVQVLTSRDKATGMFKRCDAPVPRLIRRGMKFAYYSPYAELLDYSVIDEYKEVQLCGVKLYRKIEIPTALNKVKQLSHSIQELEQAIHKDENGLHQQYYQLAYECYKWQKYKKSLSYLNQAILIYANQGKQPPHYLYKLKYSCLVELEDDSNNIKGLKLITQLYPEHTELTFYLALLNYKLARYQQSRQLFMNCIKLGEKNNDLVKKGSGSYLSAFYIGLCYEQENNLHKAEEFYRNALKINSSYNAAKKALERLNIEVAVDMH